MAATFHKLMRIFSLRKRQNSADFWLEQAIFHPGPYNPSDRMNREKGDSSCGNLDCPAQGGKRPVGSRNRATSSSV